MIKFNKLFIPPYAKGIYVDCEVCDLPYYTDVYIDKVIVEAHTAYSPSGESDNPVFSYVLQGNQKSLKLFIKDTELLVSSLPDTLFFVKVKAKGTPSSDTPCGMDNIYTIGVVSDTYDLYRRSMKYFHDCLSLCTVPKKFIDFILLYKAFTVCLKTRDFLQAIKYWKKLKKNKVIRGSTNTCGCNG